MLLYMLLFFWPALWKSFYCCCHVLKLKSNNLYNFFWHAIKVKTYLVLIKNRKFPVWEMRAYIYWTLSTVRKLHNLKMTCSPAETNALWAEDKERNEIRTEIQEQINVANVTNYWRVKWKLSQHALNKCCYFPFYRWKSKVI